jgi:hypothetical protein
MTEIQSDLKGKIQLKLEVGEVLTRDKLDELMKYLTKFIDDIKTELQKNERETLIEFTKFLKTKDEEAFLKIIPKHAVGIANVGYLTDYNKVLEEFIKSRERTN